MPVKSLDVQMRFQSIHIKSDFSQLESIFSLSKKKNLSSLIWTKISLKEHDYNNQVLFSISLVKCIQTSTRAVWEITLLRTPNFLHKHEPLIAKHKFTNKI